MSGEDNAGVARLQVENREGEPVCDICEVRPVSFDREWMGPGIWKLYQRCPECDREHEVELRTAHTIPYPTEERIRQCRKKYAQGEMKLESFERSVERLLE